MAAANMNKGGKKSGKGNKLKKENPNKDKICNHCKKNGHIKNICWTKYPEKKPKSVKNHESKQESKSSIATAATDDNEGDIILAAANH